MGERGNFFAVDRRVWARVCDTGRINWAVAYLVMARGTLGDMRTTAWSVKAIEQRTAISRPAAKLAIQGLIEAGFVERQRESTRPLYSIRSAEEVCGIPRTQPPALTPIEAGVLEVIRRHPDGVFVPHTRGRRSGWPENAPSPTAIRLARLGLIRQIKGQTYAPVQQARVEPVKGADWIWLPNTLVDGAAGETQPVDRVRNAQQIGALRLLVDMYHAQQLSARCGLYWRQIRLAYRRTLVGERGQYSVYAFTPMDYQAWSSAPFVAAHMTGKSTRVERPNGEAHDRDVGWDDFYDALHVLREIGLVEIVPHLVEADTDEGEVIHPLAWTGEGEEEEREVGIAAHRAALALMPRQFRPEQGARLVPILRHIEKAALVGLFRLRHRAKTTATADWYGRMDTWRGWAERYRNLEDAAKGACNINGTSTGDQRQD